MKKPELKKAKTKDINLAKEQPLRGKAARNDFLTDVATASNEPLRVVKKCLDGLRITVSRNLRDTHKCRIPNMISLKLKVHPACEAQTKMIFGKEKMVKARLVAVKRIVISPLKELKNSVE